MASSDKNHHYRGIIACKGFLKKNNLGLTLFLDLTPGTADAIAKMIRHEGLSGFYKGMSTKIMQSVLAAAVLFMVKEEIVKGVRFVVNGELPLTRALSSSKRRQ